MKHLGTQSQNESIVTKAYVDSEITAAKAYADSGISAIRSYVNGETVMVGNMTPTDAAYLQETSSNRLLGFPANRITLRYYNTRLRTWTVVAPSKDVANKLVSGNAEILLSNTATPTTAGRTRIDFSVSQGSSANSILYCEPRKLLVKIQDGGTPDLYIKVSGRKISSIDAGDTADSAWDTFADVKVSGWPSWVSIPLNMTFGGWVGQTDYRYGDLRIEMYSKSSQLGTFGETKIMAVRLIAPTIYHTEIDLANNNHPYRINEDGEPEFNAIVLKNNNGQTARIYLGDDGRLMASDPVNGEYRLYK